VTGKYGKGVREKKVTEKKENEMGVIQRKKEKQQ
jgi:hypothetical protein